MERERGKIIKIRSGLALAYVNHSLAQLGLGYIWTSLGLCQPPSGTTRIRLYLNSLGLCQPPTGKTRTRLYLN